MKYVICLGGLKMLMNDFLFDLKDMVLWINNLFMDGLRLFGMIVI